MPVKRLIQGLPPDKRSIVFRAVEFVLKTDLALATVVRNWRSWEGDTGKDTQPPAFDLCPMIRISHGEVELERLALELYKIPIPIVIEAFSPGTAQEDLMDFWGAVENALFSGKVMANGETVQTYLSRSVLDPATGNPAGGFDGKFSRSGSAQGRKPAPSGAVNPVSFLIGQGIYLIYCIKPI
jgi:hypothetical protein